MKCSICNHRIKEQQKICSQCQTRLQQRIADLPQLQKEASYCLQPQKGGGGTNTGEPTSGINMSALDYVIGNSILNCLWEWEKLIRSERKLTPPALLPRYPDEVSQSVKFHLNHLEWSIDQEWIEHFAREIASIHATGMTAARRFIDPVKRLSCPAEIDGKICNHLITIQGDDLLQQITCTKCATNWTPARMLAVSINEPNTQTWLDAEAIANWVGLSERQVNRIVQKNKIEKRGQLIMLQQFMLIRSEAK